VLLRRVFFEKAWGIGFVRERRSVMVAGREIRTKLKEIASCGMKKFYPGLRGNLDHLLKELEWDKNRNEERRQRGKSTMQAEV